MEEGSEVLLEGVDHLTAAERVVNGARWLDENFPGWEGCINIETLDMWDPNACICGQVFKEEGEREHQDGYWYAESTLFSEANSWISGSIPKDPEGGYDSDRADAVAWFLGFYAFELNEDDNYISLQDEWKELLRERA